MISLTDFDGLEIGDAIETVCPMPHLTDAKIELHCIAVEKNSRSFEAVFLGIHLGEWRADALRSISNPQSGSIQWATR